MKLNSFKILIALFALSTIVGIGVTNIENVFALGEFDRDYDGIPDESDKCPQLAETYNKFEDEDGCPDSVSSSEGKPKYLFVDTDGDGYEDRLDKCVFLPETFNGYLDGDGCPEIVPEEIDKGSDLDNDSIPDSIDACPKEPETFNEFKDGDGCPDSLEVLNTSQIASKDDQCRDKKIQVLRISSGQIVCVNVDTALKWEKYGIATILETPPIEEILDNSADSGAQEITDSLPSEEMEPVSNIQKLDPFFTSRSEKDQGNIQIVLSFLSTLVSLDKEKATSLLSTDYVEHNPMLSGNREGTIEYLFNLISENQNSFSFDIKRIYVDNNFVIIHSQITISDQTNSSSIDIFKIDGNGKISEHWDVMQEIPETSINENTMFYLN